MTQFRSGIVCFALLAACSSTPSFTDAGTGRGSAGIGEACTNDLDCAVGTCLSSLPGGYCGLTCTGSTDCPTGTLCEQASLTQFSCLKECSADKDCRGGYVCSFISHVCVPGCSRDEDCLGENQVCVSGQCHTGCVPRCQCPSGEACVGCPIGQVCTSPSGSINGYCDDPAGTDGGPVTCATDCDCPTGDICVSGGCCGTSTSCGGCETAADCPSSSSACVVSVCSEHSCLMANALAGSHCSDNGGTVCDVNGACVACNSDTDCPATGSACETSTCSNHVCTMNPAQSGTSCTDHGGVVCDGNGSCVACNKGDDCPDPGTTCVTNTCDNHVCGTMAAPMETTCSDNDGNVCDGNGTCVECNSAADCQQFGTMCIVVTCTANTCGEQNAPVGTACNDHGGTSCDGNGFCDTTHCSDGVKDVDETGKDCGGPTCTAMGQTCPNGDACSANSDCTSMICSGSVCVAPGCGDGVVEISLGEQCDNGPSNGMPGNGCSATCQLTSGGYVNETEPNNTQVTANSIGGTAGAVGQLSPAGDVDWYSFTVTVPNSTVTASIGDGFGGCPLSFDSRLTLYDALGNVLVSDSGGGVSPCSAITPQKYPGAALLPVGVYALKVERISAVAQPYYVLSVKVSPPGCGDGVVEPGEQCDPPQANPACSASCQFTADLIPETEPNDTPVLSNPLGTHAGFVAAIEPIGDLDYFSFQVPGPSSSVTLQVSDGVGGCPSGFDSVLTLYAPDFSQIVSDDNGGTGPCSQISPSRYTQANGLAAGTYYARVEAKGGLSTVSQYVLSISVQ